MQPQRHKPLEDQTVRGCFGIAAQEVRPRARLTPSQTVERHRFIAPGVRYSFRKTPFMREPTDCMEPGGDYLTVAIAGPGQVGKTTGPENFLLHSVMNSPGDFLWYMQSDEALQAYVKKTIDQMILMHPDMKGALGLKAIDDSLHFKRFRSLTVEFLTATEKNMINKKAPRVIGDEIDAYPKDLGDPKALLDVRRQTYGHESMLVAISHPDRANGLVPEKDWTEGIMAIYADSDRRVWWWKCPHCAAYSSPNPTAARVMTLEYDTQLLMEPEGGPDGPKRLATLDEVEASAHLLCPVNGCVIDDQHRRQMNQTGFWAGLGQVVAQDGTVTGKLIKRKTAGFWIVGVMSPFIIGGIGGLARARVKAEREMLVTGESKTLRNVICKQWGLPYTPPRALGSVDAKTLADRAEGGLTLGVIPMIPDGVRFLTCTVDVQMGYFEFLVRGWGVDGESWVIDRGRIIADPATNPLDWDKLPERLFKRTWPMADGSGRSMGVRASSIDSGGAAGVTQQAYDAWMRWKRKNLVRYFGKVGGKDGRDVFNIMLTKGANRPNSPKLSVVYPDTPRQANKAAAKGEIPLVLFNPNLFKDDLLGHLLKAEAGPWYVHFPAGGSEGFPHGLLSETGEAPHPWFEQLVAETRMPDGKWQLINPSARNEALDLMVMSHVIAHLHGLTRIKWERPPVWAAMWDLNPMVKKAPTVPPEGAPPAAPAPGAPASHLDARPSITVNIDQAPRKNIGNKLA